MGVPAPDARVVQHLLNGSAGAIVTGQIEWEESQGSTVEARVPVYAEGFAADSSLLIVRAPLRNLSSRVRQRGSCGLYERFA